MSEPRQLRVTRGSGNVAADVDVDASNVVEMSLILVRSHTSGGTSGQVLLGEKLRGFGRGRVVAPGGKIDVGESAAHAAARELQEETGLRVAVEALHLAGVLDFHFPYGKTPTLRAHVFTTSTPTGTPEDSDEIAVRWFAEDAIPYQRMWDDARHWLPRALDGTLRSMTFVYGPDGKTVERVTSRL